MFANLVCDPPLGHVSTRSGEETEVKFTVLVETATGPTKDPWEVVLWHECYSRDVWTATPLEELEETPSVFVFNAKASKDVQRRYFTALLQFENSPHWAPCFTIKFRTDPSQEWQWVQDAFQYPDGQLIFQQSTLHTSDELGAYILDLNPDLTVHEEPSQTPASNQWIWSITAPANVAKGKDSGYTNLTLGHPSKVLRWLALYRIWTPWLAPRHSKDGPKFSMDKDSIFLSFLRDDGLHLVLLAISGVEDILTVFKSDDNGNIVIFSRNDNPDGGTVQVVASVGQDFNSTVANAMNYARESVWKSEEASGLVKDEAQAQKEGQEKSHAEAKKEGEAEPAWYENWYDGLGYCTWNALGSNLSEARILEALEDLSKHNIKVTNIIIDDNWQTLDGNKWMEFEANEQFPKGLKHTITEIRRKYQHIRHVAVWHALLGYWGGISPKGKISEKYKVWPIRRFLSSPTNFLRLGEEEGKDGEVIHVVDGGDVGRFYEDFYRFLWSCGIDSVKTDAQFQLDEILDADVRKNMTKPYQDAWSVSGLRWMSAKQISCMSLVPQVIFHSQLPTNKPRLVVRNTDDFFPNEPDSHPWHIFCNAHNSIITSHLNALPDWDMFQTDHDYASFHAAARCISGGPVYITDEVGKHDMNLIRQMTARSPRGNTVILRPEIMGKTINPYVPYEEEKLLKVGSFAGGPGTGTGLLAIFNLSKRALVELVALSDFPGFDKDKEYLVRGHTTGEISKISQGHSETEKNLVGLDLGPRGWEILSACPLQAVRQGAGGSAAVQKVAALGLFGKMTGAAAVRRMDVDAPDSLPGKLKINIYLKALGKLGIYMSFLPSKTLIEDFLILILGRVIPFHTVRINDDMPEVLEVDVEQAWDELGLESGWNNEVVVQVIVK